MPPLAQTLNGRMFKGATEKLGLHPLPLPGVNASEAYVNEYGMQLGPCNYSKSTPQTCILDALQRRPNFSYRTHCEVLKVEKSADEKTATGVNYWDEKTGEEVFQPADLVILAAYQLHNTHLMLLPGLGEPYNPQTGEGVTGKTYSYQMTGGTGMFFEDVEFNPFAGAGSNGYCIDDFAINRIDFAAEGFIGGSYISSTQTNGQPINELAGRRPGMGCWLERRGQKMVRPFNVDRQPRIEHVLSRLLSRS